MYIYLQNLYHFLNKYCLSIAYIFKLVFFSTVTFHMYRYLCVDECVVLSFSEIDIIRY